MHPSAVAIVATLVACSSSMAGVVRLAAAYAQSREPVVLVGPTGSGKSRLARLIHQWSGRSGSLAEVSAGELSPTLAHDQLFGHERGAYTDAATRRRGVFAEAGSGTILLDDFHLLDRTCQTMLLRVLDTGLYRPLGTDRQAPVQSRLLVGTGCDLDALVRDDALLPDLRFRLGFLDLHLPALEERREDIVPLAEEFLHESARIEDTGSALTLTPEVCAALQAAPWPGNVRELERAMRFAHLHAREAREPAVRLDHLPAYLRQIPRYDPQSDWTTKERLVRWALWRSGDHVGRAAELIGAHRNTVSAIRLELQARNGLDLHTSSPQAVQSAVELGGSR